jgi:biotin operon repressor
MDAVAIAKAMRNRLVRIEEWQGAEFEVEREGLRCALRCLNEKVPGTRRLGKGQRSVVTLEDCRDWWVSLDGQGKRSIPFMCDELGLPRKRADRYIAELCAQGVIKPVGQGNTRGYKYVPIPRQPDAAAKYARAQAKRNGRPEDVEVVRSGSGTSVAGTGRKARISDDEVRKLARELQDAGAEVVPDNAGHYAVIHGGHRIDTLPTSPSDHRSVRNARANIRKKMVA